MWYCYDYALIGPHAGYRRERVLAAIDTSGGDIQELASYRNV